MVGKLPSKAQPAKRTSRGKLIYVEVKKVLAFKRREKRLFCVDTEGRGVDDSVVKFMVVLLWCVLFEAWCRASHGIRQLLGHGKGNFSVPFVNVSGQMGASLWADSRVYED